MIKNLIHINFKKIQLFDKSVILFKYKIKVRVGVKNDGGAGSARSTDRKEI